MDRKDVKYRKGFTLIELMVVLVIVGILAAIAVPLYTANVAKSKASEGIALLGSILTAERIYYATNVTYITDSTAATGVSTGGLLVDNTGNKYYTQGWTVSTASVSTFLATAPVTTSSSIPNVKMTYSSSGGASVTWDRSGAATNYLAW